MPIFECRFSSVFGYVLFFIHGVLSYAKNRFQNGSPASHSHPGRSRGIWVSILHRTTVMAQQSIQCPA